MKDITDTKEGILAELENKSRQEALYDDMLKTEKKFIDSLKDLKNFDGECSCEEPQEAQTISMGDEHYGDGYEVVTRCLICGGYLKEEEWD